MIYINGHFRILKWNCTVFQAIFCGDIPLHKPLNTSEHMIVQTSKPIKNTKVPSKIHSLIEKGFPILWLIIIPNT